MRAWNGDPRLRAAVLRQLDEHERKARLDPLVIEDRSIELYGWQRPNDLSVLEHELGLPAPLLALGLELFEGFPEDDVGTREHVAGVRTFLKTAHVGVDLTSVVPSFIAWRLTDQQFWNVCRDELKDLLVRVAMAILGDESLVELGDEVRAELSRNNDNARISDKDHGVVSRDHEERWALKIALAACLHRDQPARIIEVASRYCERVGLPPQKSAGADAAKLLEQLQAQLLSLMASGGLT